MNKAMKLECARSAIANFVNRANQANYDAAIRSIVKCGKSAKCARTMLEKRVSFARTFAPLK